eukprot:749815-Hanusia_phi.AAC.2
MLSSRRPSTVERVAALGPKADDPVGLSHACQVGAMHSPIEVGMCRFPCEADVTCLLAPHHYRLPQRKDVFLSGGGSEVRVGPPARRLSAHGVDRGGPA